MKLVKQIKMKKKLEKDQRMMLPTLAEEIRENQ